MDQIDTGEQSAEALNLSEVLRDCIACGVVAVDSRSRICAFNQEAAKLTALRAETLLGQSSEFLPAPFKDLVSQTFAAGGDVAEREIILPRDDGSTALLRASTVVWRGEHGELSGVVVVFNDLAVTQKLAINVQRLDRLANIGTLSASMAHEIKNALVAVNTFVEDLVEKNKDSELAGIVVRELRRIDSIVSHVLKFVGPAKPAFARVSLHRTLDQSLRLIQPQLESKKIRLHRSFSGRPDFVEGDDYQLEQAFLNVLLNAVAAMEPNGQLSVSSEIIAPSTTPIDSEAGLPERQLQVTIGDTGVGIPPENLGRLFEPFFTTKPNGTGLGLAITRRILLEHHATVNVESVVNQGTTFKMAFPLAPLKS